jgi:hypothetical protein
MNCMLRCLSGGKQFYNYRYWYTGIVSVLLLTFSLEPDPDFFLQVLENLNGSGPYPDLVPADNNGYVLCSH